VRGAAAGRGARGWAAVAVAGYLAMPWYAIEDGFFSLGWLPYYPMDPELAPAPLAAWVYGKVWLLALMPFLLLPWGALRRPRSDPWHGRLLVLAGAGGLAVALAQGALIGPLGVTVEGLSGGFDPEIVRQYGMGAGALVTQVGLLFVLTEGLAARGFVRGDGFVVGALGLVMASVAVFVFYPVGVVLLRAFELEDGGLSLAVLVRNLTSDRLWGLSGELGVAWRTLGLAVLAGAGSTGLGLCFALVVTRTGFRAKRLLRALTVLPIITPPFVIGLAIILVFGRAGLVTTWLAALFDVAPSRYIFGVPGVLLAQLLSFTPVAFLVLIGVVEGVSPSMEEAAQTLRADRWRTFTTVTLPLIRPGLANAFLLGFIESLADFGNPLVLGGGQEVLATEIYYAVAGAQSDVPRAAALALVLLSFTVVAFVAQRRWVGRKGYTTMTGKADSGAPCPLPAGLGWAVRAVAVPWALFTAVIYVMIFVGGFVKLWGQENTLTLAHFEELFRVSSASGLTFSGGAWGSLFTTVAVAAVSAPLTALLGLLTAYLLARQRFFGRGAFELGTMLSFAVPGTVVGLSYILAFNVPPIELTGTGVILVVCFVFRNMPVGIRAGLAALSQIDGSLDEASLTLGASSATTVRRVVLPLLRPAVVAALVYGFVRAMTAVSAVIFLISADYNLATTYILGRVENGDYGPAIAYSAVLIALMMVVILAIQAGVGQREVGRRKLS
jgi:iron(III) transport system permease protein